MRTQSLLHGLASLPLAALMLAPTASAFDADGICSPEDEAVGLCFQTDPGFVVEAITGPGGEFPVIDGNGNSVFSYLVTGPGLNGGDCSNVHDVSHGSIQIPVCDEELIVVDSLPLIDHLTDGEGDPSCGFGTGDTSVDVLKWDVEVLCGESAVWSVTFAGEVGTQLVEFQLKDAGNCRTGMILGPACPDGPPRFCEGTDNCPCGNLSDFGGCANSTGSGASLDVTGGSYSVLADDLLLTGSNLPVGEPGMLLMAGGLDATPGFLNSGRLCIGGLNKIIRMSGAKVVGPGGTLDFGPGLVQLTTSGAVADPALYSITAGSTWFFQIYYRDTDAANPCQPAIANLTNGLEITFIP